MTKKKNCPFNAGDLANMFSNIEILYANHQAFLKQFEDMYQKWPKQDNLG